MKILVIGTGYVGLTSGVCLAKLGHQIVCVDKNQEKIDQLKSGSIPIFEPRLEELLSDVILQKKISFSTDIKNALNDVKAVFIAVGTPQDEDGSADLSFIIKAAQEIAKFSSSYKLIITKSTVPVGTSKKITETIREFNSDLDFSVASNPEFLREGSAVDDFMSPDRIVIGVSDERAKKILSEIYQKFPKEKLVYTDVVTAEMIKYSANSFLATKITFINEISDLCEVVGGNIGNVSRAIGLDSRIGEKFLNPGPGFGGSCFPKDITAIVNTAKKNGIELSLISSVITSNKNRKEKIAKKITSILGDDFNKTIALLGLAFKANTDDVRYSPAIEIIKILTPHIKIRATDPRAMKNAKEELREFENISFFEDPYLAISGVDLIVIATEWDEYKNLDFARIAKLVKSKKIFDLRNILDEKNLDEYEHYSIGKPLN
jgi:UDPglucose 6-dehydrogenase